MEAGIRGVGTPGEGIHGDSTGDSEEAIITDLITDIMQDIRMPRTIGTDVQAITIR